MKTKISLIRSSILVLLLSASYQTLAVQTDIPGPAGSGLFGAGVYYLPNGNIVITDPGFDNTTINPPRADVGRVYFYSPTLQLLATMSGNDPMDRVGRGGITILQNGNFVILSPEWSTRRGAATLCTVANGCPLVVDATNSLVGSTPLDGIAMAVTVLANGNYVVSAPVWDDPTPGPTNVGAVRLCSGTTGCTGQMTLANSLIGSITADQVGINVTAHPNGNYIVGSPIWHNGTQSVDGGASTLCDGTTGCTGALSAANSLVGSTPGDNIGIAPILLTNGKYVIASPHWNNGVIPDAGSVTLCSGTAGCTGAVGPANSLVGTTPHDRVGWSDAFNFPLNVVALTNGNYVVGSPYWGTNTGPGLPDLGAATFCSGTIGCTGPVTAANSLTGVTAGDRIAQGLITALPNGNYVVASGSWNRTVPSVPAAGAVTFCNGTTGCTGTVTAANSLVGGTNGDGVGSYIGGFGGLKSVTALSNGNYVVSSPNWDNPIPALAVNAGSATLCSGTTGCSGGIDAVNSLVGTNTSGPVARVGSTALTNGNYVVVSDTWTNSSMISVGAATLCSGTAGCTGSVTPANSLTGSTAGDGVGNAPRPPDRNGVTPLTNGNYTVTSLNWDNGGIANAGAVTFCNGTSGSAGTTIGPSNSLVGSTANDMAGTHTQFVTERFDGSEALPDGNYVVQSLLWDNPTGPIANAGAVSFGNGSNGTFGIISSSNSVLGTVANGVNDFGAYAYNPANKCLLVGRSASRIASVLCVAPAADVGISGRVTTPAGLGLRNAIVALTDSQGIRRTATTSSFGNYLFENVPVGQTYIIGVSSKRYRFAARSVSVNENLTNVDFVGLE